MNTHGKEKRQAEGIQEQERFEETWAEEGIKEEGKEDHNPKGIEGSSIQGRRKETGLEHGELGQGEEGHPLLCEPGQQEEGSDPEDENVQQVPFRKEASKVAFFHRT